MAERVLERGVDSAAARVADLFARIHHTVGGWREAILNEGGGGHGGGNAADGLPGPAEIDRRIAALVLPALGGDDPLLIGAGFVAAPEFTGRSDLHFAWWLGPLDDNPVFGATAAPSRLDLAARSYSDYLRDFRSLEWYSIPQSTHRTHITGPYVDQLCACDYIVTVTSPVERGDRMLGVVGVDVYVKRLERELLPAMLAVEDPILLVNGAGRVLVSTDPTVVVGTVVGVPEDAVPCAGTPFRLLRPATVA